MNEYEHRIKTKKELMAFIEKFDFCFAFTGTYRQVVFHETKINDRVREFLDIEEANRNVGRFINMVSRRIIGRSRANKTNRLITAGYIEGHPRASVSGKERIHCHLLIGGPIDTHFDLEKSGDSLRLKNILEQEWKDTKWGWKQTDLLHHSKKSISPILPAFDTQQWISYIFKNFDHQQSERIVLNLPKAA